MKKVKIYTDGACSGNPGPGGWAAVLVYGDNEREISGFEEATTNNRMELTAVIRGLQGLKEPCKVEIFSDSSYVVNAFNQGWLDNWQKNGWTRGKKKEPVLNTDLWKLLVKAMDGHTVIWKKVKGHSGDKYNEMADRLAVKEIKIRQEKKKNKLQERKDG